MALTELGHSKPKDDDSVDLTGAFNKEIARQVKQVKEEILDQVLLRLKSLQIVPPAVNVQAPPSPPAPNVSVTPKIVVEDSGETTDLGGVEKRLETLSQRFDALAKALMTPVTRTVTRDNRGLITSITEKRG